MVGQLGPEEIEAFLRQHHIGRIGYLHEGRPHIVPVRFAYDGTAVYVASGLGQKITAMRQDPHVCFEVDDIDGSGLWRSVIATGVYEELRCPGGRQAALVRLGLASAASDADAAADVIVFRLHLTDKSGRFGRES
jgi:nitroimidazol reductase NimA-like FMN-containing flavoprotein (pyridoxamine 5'-phosphate oxidase superfamily)